MDNLVWVQELIEAPDLEALGTVLDARLRAYVAAARRTMSGSWPSAAPLSTKSGATAPGAQERGYAYQMRFPGMPGLWVDFVNQNKTAEAAVARLNVRRVYEAVRRDATEVANEGWLPEPKAGPPVRPETFDPIAMIDRLV